MDQTTGLESEVGGVKPAAVAAEGKKRVRQDREHMALSESALTEKMHVNKEKISGIGKGILKLLFQVMTMMTTMYRFEVANHGKPHDPIAQNQNFSWEQHWNHHNHILTIKMG